MTHAPRNRAAGQARRLSIGVLLVATALTVGSQLRHGRVQAVDQDLPPALERAAHLDDACPTEEPDKLALPTPNPCDATKVGLGDLAPLLPVWNDRNDRYTLNVVFVGDGARYAGTRKGEIALKKDARSIVTEAFAHNGLMRSYPDRINFYVFLRQRVSLSGPPYQGDSCLATGNDWCEVAKFQNAVLPVKGAARTIVVLLHGQTAATPEEQRDCHPRGSNVVTVYMPPNGGNPTWGVAVHEFSHAMMLLSDEYKNGALVAIEEHKVLYTCKQYCDFVAKPPGCVKIGAKTYWRSEGNVGDIMKSASKPYKSSNHVYEFGLRDAEVVTDVFDELRKWGEDSLSDSKVAAEDKDKPACPAPDLPLAAAHPKNDPGPFTIASLCPQ